MKQYFKIIALILCHSISKGQKLNFNFEKITQVYVKQINDIYIDDQEIVWAASDSGLIRIDTNLNVTYYNSKNSDISSDHLNKIFSDDKGNIWIGTYNFGLIKKDKNNKFEKIGFIGKEKNLLVQDVNFYKGKILVATANGLYTITQLNDARFVLQYIESEPKIPADINAILVSGDKAFIGTNSGVYQVFGSSKKISKIGNLGQVHSLAYFDNYLWAEEVNLKATNIVFFKKKWIVLPIDNSMDSLVNTRLLSDMVNNCMWIASKKLLMKSPASLLKIDNKVTFNTRLINCIATDKHGVLWIGTADNGMYRLLIKTDLGQDSKKNLYDFSKDSIRLNISFEDGKYDLTKEAKRELDNIALQLEDNKKIKIKINGHTDFGGGYNGLSVDELQELSEKRATSVKKYLLKKRHLEEGRILGVQGYGSKFAIKDGLHNMRVEIVVIER